LIVVAPALPAKPVIMADAVAVWTQKLKNMLLTLTSFVLLQKNIVKVGVTSGSDLPYNKVNRR
jgi:hypothetical protein